VQQERPAETGRLLVEWLAGLPARAFGSRRER
jgi:hypothetical protein